MENFNLKFRKFYFLITLTIFLFSTLSYSQAATLYLEPQFQGVRPGDIFIEQVRLDTEKPINAVEFYLDFPPEFLEALDFSTGNSVLSIWAKGPIINQQAGTIYFVGGTPKGIEEDNLLGKIIFQAKEIEIEEGKEINAEIKLQDNSQVLLNNGLGTPADLTLRGANVKILPVGLKLEEGPDEWQRELAADNIPPDPFQPQISQDVAGFEGQYLLVFSTVDNQTGINFYQVKEGDRSWQKVKSPYLLTDQELKSVIKVKAIDKAGNERVAIIRPRPIEIRVIMAGDWVKLIILILIAGGIIWWFIRREKMRKKYKSRPE